MSQPGRFRGQATTDKDILLHSRFSQLHSCSSPGGTLDLATATCLLVAESLREAGECVIYTPGLGLREQVRVVVDPPPSHLINDPVPAPLHDSTSRATSFSLRIVGFG
jgi:hypothetical protein